VELLPASGPATAGDGPPKGILYSDAVLRKPNVSPDLVAAEAEAAVLVAGPLVGGGGGVAAEHGPRPPAGEAHEAAFGAVGVEEGVGEGMAELVGVDVGRPGGLGPLADHLGDAPEAHRAMEPERAEWPLRLRRHVRAAGMFTEVALESEGGLVAEGTGCRRPSEVGGHHARVVDDVAGLVAGSHALAQSKQPKTANSPEGPFVKWAMKTPWPAGTGRNETTSTKKEGATT
jgi:hypothetical protein